MVAQTSEASLIHTPHDRPPLDVDAVIKAITTIQEETNKQSIYTEKGEVKIKSPSPILLVVLGDLHIGNQATDHKKTLEIMKTIRDTPNTFAVFNGDLVDNLFVFRKGGAEEAMTAEMQGMIAMQFKYLEMRSPNADIVIGNHTHRKVIEMVLINGVYRVLGEGGTMKIKDTFQVGHGNARFGQFDYCGISVLLFPDQKKMIPFYHLEDGIEAVKGKLFIKQALFKGAGKILKK